MEFFLETNVSKKYWKKTESKDLLHFHSDLSSIVEIVKGDLFCGEFDSVLQKSYFSQSLIIGGTQSSAVGGTQSSIVRSTQSLIEGST